MLLSFRFTNFRSFVQEQELSFVAGSVHDKTGIIRSDAVAEAILPVAAIYGANAAGKTNVLRALKFMSDAVVTSFRKWRPNGPILHDPSLATEASRSAPSEFCLDFVVKGVRFQYGFHLNAKEIIEEWLNAYPNGRQQRWFHRVQGTPIAFSAKLAGDNKSIENLTRKNSLFLSAAAQGNHETLLPIYGWFERFLLFALEHRADAVRNVDRWLQKPSVRASIDALLSNADLGVTRATATPRLGEDVLGAKLKRILNSYDPQFRLSHSFGGKNLQMELSQESNGTLAYLALLGPVIQARQDGGLLCIDELDASLHPLLAIQLIRLFNNSSTNPSGAQLLFTTHDSNLLSAGVLRRDQIWFAEKDRDGSSSLYPLTDFKPRQGENLEKGYLQGRYGAIPFLNPDAFLKSLKAQDEKA